MLVFIGKLTEFSHMRTHVTGVQSSFKIFASFCISQISHQQHNLGLIDRDYPVVGGGGNWSILKTLA